MRKDQIKKNTMRRQALQSTRFQIRSRWVLLLSAIVILFLIACILLKIWRINEAQALKDSWMRFSTWISQHKTLLHHDATGVKKIVPTNQTDDAAQIHFEFYTTLPNMQMDVANDKPIPDKKPAEKPIKSDEKILTAANAFLNPEQLEKEFAKDLKQNNYIVQIASFRSLNSAERLRLSLIAKGFQAVIVKWTVSDNIMYRVQLGPFQDKNQAKLLLKQLQKKGNYGILRKIDNSKEA